MSSPHSPAPGFAQGRYHPVMGTDLLLQAWARDEPTAQAAERAALAEVLRLEQLFSIHRDDSQLSRWRRGELDVEQADPALSAVLALARGWWQASGGAFHPACRALYRRWQQAEREDRVPDRREMQELADSLAELPWALDEQGMVRRTGDASGADVYAVVKGWIVDAALAAAQGVARSVDEEPAVRRVQANAGGDLAHRGEGSWPVHVEDPLRPNDNGADRLFSVEVAGAALATSSLARRGFRVAGQWFGHVLDPRTGWPVDHLAQVSVLADDAATADALATVCGVMAVDESLAFVRSRPGCRAWLVTAQGELIASH